MKYKKLPVEIEAVQWTGNNLNEMQDFFNNIDYWTEVVFKNGKPYILLHIRTLEGDMTVKHGDYIIKGVNSEFYPCKPDILKKHMKL